MPGPAPLSQPESTICVLPMCCWLDFYHDFMPRSSKSEQYHTRVLISLFEFTNLFTLYRELLRGIFRKDVNSLFLFLDLPSPWIWKVYQFPILGNVPSLPIFSVTNS